MNLQSDEPAKRAHSLREAANHSLSASYNLSERERLIFFLPGMEADGLLRTPTKRHYL
jgi:hypothetical protein